MGNLLPTCLLLVVNGRRVWDRAMPRYRRSRRRWGAYFLTVVTHDRFGLFGDATARTLLGRAMRKTFEKHPLTVHEMVLLPDHLHILCGVGDETQDYSLRIQPHAWVTSYPPYHWPSADWRCFDGVGVDRQKPTGI